ncbi:peptidase M24, structural domain-containing protein [Rhodotorula toruloides]
MLFIHILRLLFTAIPSLDEFGGSGIRLVNCENGGESGRLGGRLFMAAHDLRSEKTYVLRSSEASQRLRVPTSTTPSSTLHRSPTMGLLSCFGPLFPARSSAASVCSEATLIDKSTYAHVEKCEAKAAHHAVQKEDRTGIRLAALRREMQDAGVDAYVIPSADAHGSEWVGACDERRAFISNFTGSAGTAIVTPTEAHLFTDSRYFVQAAKQLDSNWTLEKVGSAGVKNWNEWLLELPKDSKIGVDAALQDYGSGKALSQSVKSRGLELVFPAENLVDQIWHDRPSRTQKPIHVHPLKFTGKSAKAKIADLRSYLSSNFPTAENSPSPSYLVTSLTAIAWLLNLRGGDIAHNPVFYAYVLVEKETVKLWVQEESLSDEVRSAIAEFGGEIRDYKKALDELAETKGMVVTDSKSSWAIVERLGEENVEIVKSPVETAQAVKNEVEIQGFRNAYLRDGAAWARWQAWLEEQLEQGKEVTEWDAGEKLTSFRKGGQYFAGLAYENISASGENAALPHYEPSPDRPTPISRDSPYLNDSGAQYLDGTIDTTRTMHFGKPTREQKRAFTRVLQGHIAVDSLIFPEGTTGDAIDALARAPLWSEGMNYGHGTGHGLGEYLSVHESQVGIAHSAAYFGTPFQPGHTMSNEPGYYEERSYGIRLESVLIVKEVKTRRDFGDRRWLGFEQVTMVPIQTKMVDYSLLTPHEKRWLRDHNRLCAEKLLPLVKHDKRAERWLRRQ